MSVAVRSAEKAEDPLEQSRKSVEAAERLTEAKMCIKAIAVELAPRDTAERLRKAAEEGISSVGATSVCPRRGPKAGKAFKLRKK